MKRRVRKGMIILVVLLTMLFSVSTYASSNTRDFTYGGLTLTCYINCTNTYGEGSTGGAGFDGYRNYIKVITYDINQSIIEAKEGYSIFTVSKKNSTGSPYLTRTYHAAADNYNIQLLPVYQQIQQAQGRWFF